jgi:prolipoprotein diacylglyceryltransferase/protein-S-isoprenylcysteine O-methyltransferase Ste14
MKTTAQAVDIAVPRFVGFTGSLLVIAVYVAVYLVALPLIVWRLGDQLDLLLRLPRSESLTPVGWLLLSCAAPLWVWSMVWLSVVGRGLPVSSLPPRRLVKSGPYALLRHPIYVGFTLSFAGVGCIAQSWGHGVLAPLVLGLGCAVYVVAFEGPALRRRFGVAYASLRSENSERSWVNRLANLGAAFWMQMRPQLERFANFPVLFRVGPTIWVTYGLFVALGAALVALLGPVVLGSLLSFQQYAAYAIGLALTMPVGGRLLALAYSPVALWREKTAALRRVGFVSWGGYAAFFAFTAVFGRVIHVAPLSILDRVLPLFFAAASLGRLGCFSYGCCYGRPSEHGIRWMHPDAKPVRLQSSELGSLARVPTQLLASAASLGVAVLSAFLLLSGSATGTATGLSVFIYALTRLGIEELRDEPRFGAWQWTRGQWGALITAIVSLSLLLGLDPLSSTPNAFGAITAFSAIVSLVCGALVFVVCGLHLRQVGRW